MRRAWAAGAVVAAAGLVAAVPGAAQEPPAAPVAAQVLATGPFVPVGIADAQTVIAQVGDRVVALTPGAPPRKLFKDKRLASAVAGPGQLAVVQSNLDADGNPPRRRTPYSLVRAGGLDGPFKALAFCTGPDATLVRAIPPVAGDRVIAASSCDRTKVVLSDASMLSSLPAGGQVEAVAAAGRRLAWVVGASGGAAAAVHVHDLDTATERAIALPSTPTAESPPTIALAADGRLEVDVTTVGRRRSRCVALTLAASDAAPQVGDCLGITDTDEGGLRTRVTPTRVQVVRVDRTGRPFAVLAQERVPGAGGHVLAASALRPLVGFGQTTFVRRACAADQVVLEPLESPGGPLLTCRARVTDTTLRVDARGGLAVPLRCPKGCRVTGTLRLPGGVVVLTGHAVRVGPGGSGALRFVLPKTAEDARGAVLDLATVAGRPGRVRLSLAPAR